MRFLRYPVVLTLGALAVFCAPLGCASSEGGAPDFSLKVVVEPSGQPASSSCVNRGTTGTGGTNDVGSRWLQIASHDTEADGAWYEVDITAFDGKIHSWRYDEAAARENLTLDVSYLDGSTLVDVSISSASAPFNACTP